MVLKIGFSFAVLAGLCFTSRLVCVHCTMYAIYSVYSTILESKMIRNDLLFIDYARMEFIFLNDIQSWAMATCYLMYIFPRIFF